MKINLLGSTLILIAVLVLALIAAPVIFFARAPVLIVIEESFLPLYGEARIKAELARSSLSLYRRVKNVTVADDAGDDLIQIAASGASKKPFCVIFQLRFAQAAKFYREQKPEVPVILLEGRYAEDANPSIFGIGRDKNDDYFIYKTDIDADFYRAGIAAGLIDEYKNGRIVVFLEPHIRTQARDAFSRAFKEMEKPQQPVYYTTFSQFSTSTDITCVVCAGSGAEFMEKTPDVPVIFFSWLSPALIPDDVALLFDDSPWVQAVPAARMAAAGVKKGLIPSKIRVLSGKNIDGQTLKKLKKLR